MTHEPGPHADPDPTPTAWSLWHFQSLSDDWTRDDDELPHLPIGLFATRVQAAEVRDALRRRPGLRDWPLGFRLGWAQPDLEGAWDQGFVGWCGGDATLRVCTSRPCRTGALAPGN